MCVCVRVCVSVLVCVIVLDMSNFIKVNYEKVKAFLTVSLEHQSYQKYIRQLWVNIILKTFRAVWSQYLNARINLRFYHTSHDTKFITLERRSYGILTDLKYSF